RRALGASASPVARGGETGWWQWLLPALVVLVVAFAALDAHRAGTQADAARAQAARATAFVSAVQDARAAGHGERARSARHSMFAALRAVEASAGGDRTVALWRPAANAAVLRASDAGWQSLAELAS